MGNGSNSGNGRNNLPALTNETIGELIAVQKQQLTIRLEEIRLESAELGHNQSIAKQSIETHERDRKHNREEITKRQQSTQWFAGAVVVAMLVFSGYAVSAGQTALVVDLIKIIAGFAGGMGFQAYRSYKKPESEED